MTNFDKWKQNLTVDDFVKHIQTKVEFAESCMSGHCPVETKNPNKCRWEGACEDMLIEWANMEGEQ
jgi:hypothetical protein